ncbi:MAG: polysaccharide export protein [Proteobacteria bacterium]|nr:polysaccharide export protein [Pseudomonadota bacterium]
MIRSFFLFKTLVLAVLLAGSLHAAEGDTSQANYRLGAGDKLSISVFNQADLSGEYTINGSGRFVMPYIDGLQASGLTIPELTGVIVSKLKPDYLLNPRVSIEVLNFRPYYIIGEISSKGSYPFVEGITYLNAVAIAGGFSYRARKKYVMVKRKDNPEGEEVKLELNDFVRPGDIIRVTERLF